MTYMRTFLLLLGVLVTLIAAQAAETASDLSLQDGSRIKGRVMSTTATEVTVMSDFGAFRIPLEKLTPESRASLGEAAKPDVDALLRRISELEARVARLQQENESLRRSPTPQMPTGSSFQSITPPSGGSSGMPYTVSSTGKRHNPRCRYFGSGRPAGPNEGVACKICGG